MINGGNPTREVPLNVTTGLNRYQIVDGEKYF